MCKPLHAGMARLVRVLPPSRPRRDQHIRRHRLRFLYNHNPSTCWQTLNLQAFLAVTPPRTFGFKAGKAASHHYHTLKVARRTHQATTRPPGLRLRVTHQCMIISKSATRWHSTSSREPRLSTQDSHLRHLRTKWAHRVSPLVSATPTLAMPVGSYQALGTRSRVLILRLRRVAVVWPAMCTTCSTRLIPRSVRERMKDLMRGRGSVCCRGDLEALALS